MQIVINIDEKDYNEIMVMKNNCSKELSFYEEIIGNGVVLPEYHGRLIDADKLMADIDTWCDCKNGTCLVKNALTILEGTNNE